MQMICIIPTKTLTKDVFYPVVPLTRVYIKTKTKFVEGIATHRTAQLFGVMNDNAQYIVCNSNRFK